MEIAFYASKISNKKNELIPSLGNLLVPILYSDEPYIHVAACWAFAWLGETHTWSPEHKPDVIPRLLEIWRGSQIPDVNDKASWAISELPIIDRELVQLPESSQDLIDFIKQKSSLKFTDENRNTAKVLASLVIAFYLKAPWTDEELSSLVISKYYGKRKLLKIKELLKALGEPGKVQLEVLKQKESSTPRKPITKSNKNKEKHSKII